MKSMCHHQTRTGIPKHFPKKSNQAPCTIFYIEKIKTFPIVTTFDTNNLQPGELIHVDFFFYDVTSICGFTSMITVVYENTIILWLFHTALKQSHVFIIHCVPKTLKNEQHICKHVRVGEDGFLEKSVYVANFLVDEFKISMETTGGYAS